MKKSPFYLSVDLEDFTFDLMRSIGLEPRVNFDALTLGYKLANEFSIKKLNSQKLTFFTTGTVALTYPDLLKEISSDGHEIACHYHYHDLMFKQSNDQIDRNLSLAKEAIFKASGHEPIGFRAPVFSIPRERVDIFDVIEKHFLYDSSYVLYLNKFSKDEYYRGKPFTLKSLKEFPIVPKPFFNAKANVKSGGTFLRLFTKKMMVEVMEYNQSLGFTPLVYMHPYDYLENREFWVPLKDFFKAKSFSSFIKYPRQFQWQGLRNKTVFPKLEFILESFEHQGKMSELLK